MIWGKEFHSDLVWKPFTSSHEVKGFHFAWWVHVRVHVMSVPSVRQPCKYGAQCYRQNPAHFEQFSHPTPDKGSKCELEEEAPPAKKPKIAGADNDDDVICLGSVSDDVPVVSKPHPSQMQAVVGGSALPMFYLTRVRGITEHYNRPEIAIGIKDILSMGDLISSVQFNYMFDIDWLVKQYPESKRRSPISLVHGDQRNTTAQLRRDAQGYPNIKLLPAKLNDPFGTHHSKMMLLRYREGVRVVVHTANLIHKDWDQKTQGVWVSPVFPKLQTPLQSQGPGRGGGDFKRDLTEYLRAYNIPSLNEWVELLEEHDTTSARVRLVASVPGTHKAGDMKKWGHLKLRQVLSEAGPSGGVAEEAWPVIGQFSSIGSLGPANHSWLTAEWLLSLSTCRKGPTARLHKNPNLKLIFPSVDNVRRSLEGYMAGGSIPYAMQTAQKQPYLTSYFHQWRAEHTGRSRAAPHIKTYCRASSDGNKVAWFLLSSANLSKAAWGGTEKKGTQLRIRSYEVGVLFLPSLQSPPVEHFELKTQLGGSTLAMPVPYDLPLTTYTKEDEPWIWDRRRTRPDSCGNVWTPD